MSQAVARFLCCERSCWQATTMPDGICVMRTAESVRFTCWPPAPEARKVSMRQSDSLISILMRVVDHRIDPDAGEGRVPAGIGIEGEMRTSRCTPDSVLGQP